jgi:hypothetical protein
MTDPRCIPIGEPGGTWSKVVKRIERDGGPILPHTPPPTSDNVAILNEAGQNIAPVTGPHPHAETFGRNYVAQEVPGVDGYMLRIPIPVKPHLSSTPSELPAAPRLGVACNCSIKLVFHDDPADSSPMFEGFVATLPAHQEIHVSNAYGSEPPTPAETLALADELTAAGTPDETLVGEELRAALLDGIAERLTAALLTEHPGYAVEYARPPAASFAEALVSIEAAVDRDRTANIPTRIKLTAEQIDAYRLRYQPGTTMLGYPVDLVGTVEESTPYLEAIRAAESVARPSKVNVPPLARWPVPTVGFHEPPQPGWLARVIRRIFG